MHPELFDAFGHTPVFVDNQHLGAHQTSGGVFVIFQQVDDVAGLFNVVYELAAVFLVKFHKHVGGFVAIEQPVEMFRLFYVKFLKQLCNVGRVEVIEYGPRLHVVVGVDDMADFFEKFLVEFFHAAKRYAAGTPYGLTGAEV